MSNAAIYFEPEPYDAARADVMGRHSAGQGFLTGFLRHADVPDLHLWNALGLPQGELEVLVERLGPPARPVRWLGPGERSRLAEAGAVHFPWPMMGGEAWARRAVGATRYSLTAVTHTVCEHALMDEIGGLLIAPVEPWDALVCTSQAVRMAIQTQLEAVADHLHERLGADRVAPVQIAVIPLGVESRAFERDEAARRRWREALDIPEEALVALYVGRFNVGTKMNPAPMGLALQKASERTGQPIYWVLRGWGLPEAEAQFRAAASGFCPDVRLRFVTHAVEEPHGPVWSAADLFLSFSDNIQESFGLTPVEAMAAGLPCVVSDWNGYRDTVRDGVDGFRIPTLAPRSGLGADIAYNHAHGFERYDGYAGATSQFVAVDIEAAAAALTKLIESPELRRRFGDAGRVRARTVFDWSVLIPQYQELWTELARRRAAAPSQPPRTGGENPWRLDPFRMFGAYPSDVLSRDHVVTLTGDLDVALSVSSVRRGSAYLPTVQEAETLLQLLADGPLSAGVLLDAQPAARRAVLERGLVWLAKFGVVRLARA